jgi:hypothetical protein
MRQSIRLIACVAVLLSIVVVLPLKADACTCCANWGSWYEDEEPLREYHVGELARLRFSPRAKLFQTDVDGHPGLSGEANPTGDFSVSLSAVQRHWELLVRHKGLGTGRLRFNIPNAAITFGVDLHDGKHGGGGGPLLYKELRMEGPVNGDGMFGRGMAPGTRFRLLLQGRGNNCIASDQYTHWNLRVFGRKANYSFYGSIERPKRD